MFTNNKKTAKKNTEARDSDGLWSSFIDSSLRISGDMFSDGDLHIEGQIDGDIRGNELTIGRSARIHGTIFADHVRVSGSIDGDITARVVEVFSNAYVVGNIMHESLAIEAGAHIEGMCKRGEIVPLLEGPSGQKKTGPVEIVGGEEEKKKVKKR